MKLNANLTEIAKCVLQYKDKCTINSILKLKQIIILFFKVLMRSHCAEIIKDEHKNVHFMGEFKVN